MKDLLQYVIERLKKVETSMAIKSVLKVFTVKIYKFSVSENIGAFSGVQLDVRVVGCK
uniref:Uncharacterized protein n=1 Tax=Anopheles minimus TaxID=112268 RepID=A0A182WNM0_9DIPT